MTLITVGWCLQAQAQPTDFSLPPLPDIPMGNAAGNTGAAPPIPSTPIAPNAGAKKNSPAPNEQADAPSAIPELANLPTPTAAPVEQAATEPAAPTETATEQPAAPALAATAPALPPMINEGTDMVQGEQAVLGGQKASPLNVSAPQRPPGLDLPTPPPGISLPSGAGMASNNTGQNNADAASMLPEIDVEAPAPRPAARSWKTKLAPSSTPKITSFNYRRQVLPDAIYRKSYDRENQHLPVQVTRNDYSRMLIERVAANDINGTRALLNEGLSVNTVDGDGQSLLTVARRFGARDTERLLVARGAS